MKTRLLACLLAVVLAVILVLKWPMIISYVRHQNRNRLLRNETSRLRQVLESAHIPITQLSFDSRQRGIALRLEGTSVRDITVLSGFNISYLSLSDSAVSNISPLKTCPLQSVDLSGAPVRDLSPLEGSGVELLILRDTPITNFASLAKMPHLYEVSLTRAQIMQNLDLLRSLRLRVDDGQNSVLAGFSEWSNLYENAKASDTRP